MKSNFMRTVFAIVLAIVSAVPTFAQDSFAYQAVIRDANGELITNKEVNLKFSLMQGNSTYYVETQKAKANEYGNISVEIGKGTATQGAMADVPWSTFDIRMKVEVDAAGGNKFVTLGETKFLPVPYAMYAATSDAATVSGATKAGENLFEVTDRDGNTVFAVTPNGIVVYVDDTPDSKAARSGFIVTGRTATKDGQTNDYFTVTADGTQVFIDDDPSKAARSGFIVTGRTASKNQSADSYEKSDRTADTDLFAIDGSLTTVYVDEDSDSNRDKAARSGFVVTGRTATKGGKIVDINAQKTDIITSEFTVMEKATESTEPIVDPSGEEPAPTQPKSLFTITGGQVEVTTEVTMIGDVAQKVEADVIDQEIEIEPIVVNDEELYAAVTCDYLPNVTDYALLAIYDEDAYVPVSKTNDEYIILFDEFGHITKQHKKAAAIVVLRKEETEEFKIYVRALAAMHQTVEFGLMDATSANAEPYQFIQLKAEINAEQGHPFATVETDHGKVMARGDLFYGSNVDFIAEPENGYYFTNWEGVDGHDYIYNSDIYIDYEPRVPVFAKAELFVGDNNNASDDDEHGFSADKPFASLNKAIGVIQDYSQHNANWTIFVSGTVEGNHIISGRNIADSITITGLTPMGSSAEPQDELTASSGSVLTINTGVPVIISNLKIAGGTESGIKMDMVPGNLILDNGALITGNGSVAENDEVYGGGVYVNAVGKLTMNSGSVISGNKAFAGGGVYLYAMDSKLIMNGGSISTNKATEGGGVYVGESGSFVMAGGQIISNKANTGVGVYNNGTFVMSGGAKVDNNNDVLIQQDKYVTVGGTLDGSGKVAVITLVEEEEGVPVVGVPVIKSLDGALSNKILTRFELNHDCMGMVLAADDNTTALSTSVEPIYVGPNDTEEEHGDINSPYKTIANAIGSFTNATANYVIKINGTVYEPQIIGSEIGNGEALNANRVTVTGANEPNADGTPTDILNGNQHGSVLTIRTPTPVIIKNLTITRGKAARGGGIFIGPKSVVTLADGAFITGNEATTGGVQTNHGGGVCNLGTLFMYGSAVIGDNTKNKTATNTTYCSNTAWYGGGLYNHDNASAYLGFRSATDTVELTGGIYYNYSGTYNYGYGGGICNYGTIVMSSGNIAFNASKGNYANGAGVYTGGVNHNSNTKANFELLGGTIHDNKCYINDLCGGGVCIYDGSFIMKGGEISNNEANYGGGVSVANASTSKFIMTGGVIKNNTANNNNSAGVRFDKGTFKIGKSAVIDASNEVGINKNLQITISEPFDNSVEQVATIVGIADNQQYYENGLQVLKDDNENAYVVAFSGMFNIKPQTFVDNGKEYNTNWVIDENGCMQRMINVYAYTTGDKFETFNLYGSAPIDIEYEGTDNGCFNYSFGYWAVKATDGSFVKVEAITHDTTVYAIWEATTNSALETALNDMHDSRCNYIINVNGQISGQTQIPATLMEGSALSLTLNGASDNASLNGNGSTALTVSTAVPVIIKNLTITGGNASNGGGIYINNGANVTLSSGAKVSGNRATLKGGGIYTSGTLVLDGGVVGDETATTHATYTDYSNYANQGGGIYFDNTGKVLIKEGSVVAYNFGYQGGGIATASGANYEDAELIIEGGVIQYNGCDPQLVSYPNSWSSYGGGLFLNGCKFVLTGDGSIHHNFGCDGGGGLFLQHTEDATMSGGSIHNNTWNENGYKNGSEVLLFENCTLSMVSGSIYADNAESNGVMLLQSSASLEMEGTATISPNTPVCLTSGTYITVTGTLNNSNVATITPPSYSEEVQVLDGDYADSQGGKFNVTKEGDKQWCINHGYLCDKFVYNTDNYDGDKIEIYDPSIPYVIGGSEIYYGQIDIFADGSNVPYDITLSYINIQHDEDWSSALILYNKIDNNEADFKITLEGNNILYGHNHSGFKLDGGDDDRGEGRDYVIGAKSNVIFDVKPGTSATLEFKNNYAGTPCLDVANGLEATFSLAEGCEFVGKISKAEIYADDIDGIDRENDDLFNVYDSNTYSDSQGAFNAFINDARVKDGQVAAGQYLFILKIERKN